MTNMTPNNRQRTPTEQRQREVVTWIAIAVGVIILAALLMSTILALLKFAVVVVVLLAIYYLAFGRIKPKRRGNTRH